MRDSSRDLILQDAQHGNAIPRIWPPFLDKSKYRTVVVPTSDYDDGAGGISVGGMSYGGPFRKHRGDIR
jgi:hypothetical protein